MAKRTMIVVVHPLYNEAECFEVLDESMFYGISPALCSYVDPWTHNLFRDSTYTQFKTNVLNLLKNRSQPAILLEEEKTIPLTSFLQEKGYVDWTIPTKENSGCVKNINHLKRALKGYGIAFLVGQYSDGCVDEAKDDLEIIGKKVIIEEKYVYPP